MNAHPLPSESCTMEQPTAARTEPTERQLASALGRIDDEITISEMCRGFVSGLLNQVTALSGLSELVAIQASQGTVLQLVELAGKLRTATERMASETSEFLDHPYLDARSGPRIPGRANACVDALVRLLFGHRLFTAGGCRFVARGTVPDLCFDADPIRLITGLRHLVEYCAMRVGGPKVIALTVGPATFGGAPANLVKWRVPPHQGIRNPGVGFRIATTIPGFHMETFQRDLRDGSKDPRSGNLLMLAAAISDENLGFEVEANRSGASAFNVYASQYRG